MTALPLHVLELAERAASTHGVEVLELKLRGQGRGRVLSVILDADDPVEADVVERVSKDLSRALDQADPLPGSYTLEVTTPGLGRPLQTARDFRRQRGHEVSIVRGGDTPSVQGVVLDADGQAVTLDVDGSEVLVPLSDVVRGKVVLPW
ncbi:MAG TPA: ribosome maturation factor RimP [Actinomycetota bacterium]|nr:ribosome maturation factor RimP [Actinomycetota bacterium]